MPYFSTCLVVRQRRSTLWNLPPSPQYQIGGGVSDNRCKCFSLGLWSHHRPANEGFLKWETKKGVPASHSFHYSIRAAKKGRFSKEESFFRSYSFMSGNFGKSLAPWLKSVSHKASAGGQCLHLLPSMERWPLMEWVRMKYRPRVLVVRFCY